MTPFGPWVAQLLTLGEVEVGERWLDYRALGVTPDHVPDLLRLLADRKLARHKDNVRASAPVHAWRALAQLGEAAGDCAADLLKMLHWRIDLDDITGEDMPVVLAATGPRALPELLPLVKTRRVGPLTLTVTSALEEMALYHPETRAVIVDAVASQMREYRDNEAEYNGYLAWSLAELRAAETALLVQAAFAADAVDISVCGPLADLAEELGLPDTIAHDGVSDGALEFERRMRCGGDIRDLEDLTYRNNNCYHNATLPALQERLHRMGISLERETFRALAREVHDADDIAGKLPSFAGDGLPLPQRRVEMLLAGLWRHWLPERPCREEISMVLQLAENRLRNSEQLACEKWRETWEPVQRLVQANGWQTVAQLDQQHPDGKEIVIWLGDLETAFYNVGMPDERIAFISEVLATFPGDPRDVSTGIFRRGLADAYRDRYGREQAEKLFRNWLRDDPQWGWGWIGWADLWFGPRAREADAARANAILREGLAIAGVRDRDDILGRLSPVLAALGYEVEAESALAATGWDDTDFAAEDNDEFADSDDDSAAMERDFEAWRVREGLEPGPMPKPGPPVHRAQVKIGRNAPCPCGSGRKYKHCCGR